MKLVGRIPVEPLDDERLTNLERRIVAGAAEVAARPAREARWSPLLAVAVSAVALAGAGALGWRLGRGDDGGPGAAGAPVLGEAAQLELRTAAERATLDLGDARIDSEPGAAFTVARPGGGVRIALARGRIALDVAKRAGRAPLVVAAGETEVVVVGTRFSVDYGDGTGDVDVRVTEGVVRVVRHRQETPVVAGQAWTSRRGLVAMAAPAGGGGAGAAGGAGGDATAAAATVPSADAAAGARGDEAIELDPADAPDVLRGRVAAVPGAREAHSSAAIATGPARTGGTDRPPGGGSGLDDRRDPRFDLKAAIRSQPVLPALEVGEPDAERAMARYRQIMTREKGPSEAHAFYSMAVIQSLKLGRSADALTTLAAFKRRAPTNEYFVPALWLEVRIRCLRAIDGECRAAAEAYQRRAPDGPAARVAERITLSK